MLNVRQSLEGGVATFSLSGHVEASHIQELEDLIGAQDGPIALNLQEVTIVGPEVVNFLAQCETKSIALRNCPPYVRAWLNK